jgi:hypothetical protein
MVDYLPKNPVKLIEKTSSTIALKLYITDYVEGHYGLTVAFVVSRISLPFYGN